MTKEISVFLIEAEIKHLKVMLEYYEACLKRAEETFDTYNSAWYFAKRDVTEETVRFLENLIK